MTDFDVSIYASDRIFYKGQFSSIIVPTPVGQYGILADHRNLISAVSEGILTVTIGQEKHYAIVSKGLIKVEEGKVLLLVDTCEKPDEIDEKRALRAKEEAERKLRQKASFQVYHIAQANLSRAINRLKNSRKKDTRI